MRRATQVLNLLTYLTAVPTLDLNTPLRPRSSEKASALRAPGRPAASSPGTPARAPMHPLTRAGARDRPLLGNVDGGAKVRQPQRAVRRHQQVLGLRVRVRWGGTGGEQERSNPISETRRVPR